MDCACMVRKICGYYYYKKGVFVQIIRSTTRRHFWGRNTVPHENVYVPKNKPNKNARNHGNLTMRTSELHERAINSKKRLQCYYFLEERRKGFNLCWRSNAIVEPKSAQQKIDFWGALHIRGEYFHAFQTNRQIGHLRGAPKTKMA